MVQSKTARDQSNPIKVDVRERLEVEDWLKREGYPTSVETLQVGDYAWYSPDRSEVILVTRKAADFFESLTSGHLQDEIKRCIQFITAYGLGRLFFLQEGLWAGADFKTGGLGYFERAGNEWFRRKRDFRGTIKSHFGVQASCSSVGVHVLQTGSPVESGMMIGLLYDRTMDGWPTKLTQGLPKPLLRWSTDDEQNEKITRLMALWPRVPERVLLRILHDNGGSLRKTLMKMMQDPDSFAEYKGIGAKLIKNLKEVLQ